MGQCVAQAKEGAKATFNSRNISTNLKLIVDVLKGLKLNLQTGINQSNPGQYDIAKRPSHCINGTIAAFNITPLQP